KTEISMAKLLKWADVPKGKFHEWRKRYGKANEHNGKVPRDHWLEIAEREAIVEFYDKNPLNGYRRISFMMIDADVVAASPATVYRVLKGAGRLDRWNRKPSSKGTDFVQPKRPHQHWHADITYINVAGTFYYLCLILDGYSRYIVHWELRESMKETDVEIVLQRARERFPGVTARLITDNGPQFVARDFRDFIRLSGREAEIFALRDQRLEAARARRKERRVTARAAGLAQTSSSVTQPQPQSDFR
ncbi:MAG TPA: DDE-type integrase/transposase/recombinase, partial [Enhygromyxa sp.]|nr:DDE-type integrase/transposase/recombinase [Enhygromyxa sp.]